VKEDVERGRVYLSADLLRETWCDRGAHVELANGRRLQPNELALLRGFELHAQTLYRSAALIPLLDRDARPAMRC
jgi:phytoene synthase